MAAPLFTVAASLLVCATAVTGTIPPKAVSPVVAKTTDYGDLVDPGLNRDSCTSTLWSDNVLWVCRDTQQVLSNGSIGHQLVANTASFSSLPSSRSHHQQLLLSSPEPYGTLFYPFQQDECPANGCGDNVCGPGICGPGSRWIGWPDTTPLVVARDPFGTGWVDAYGWMAKQRLDGLTVLNATGNVLFRVTSRVSGEKKLPTTTFVDTFWSPTEIGYGTAAHVIHEEFAYLYGGTPNAELAVARVNLAGGSFENRKSYEFYVNGTWTRKTPLFTDPGAILPNTSAKQGTVYWSPKWKSFVWIGGDGFPDANGLISTAPKAEGPWSAPIQFYSGSIGNGTLPAYSLVAHPGLTDGTGDYIFISWTKTHPDPATGFAVYTQPLVRVDWK